MECRELGTTGIRISALAFGAGPIPAVMIGGSRSAREQIVGRAIDAGINWFDTAATYGEGRSEQGLGEALSDLGAAGRVHLATKVRLTDAGLENIESFVAESVRGSLSRLRVPAVTLLQLHNAITRNRNDEPTSIMPVDVLGPKGVVEAFERLRRDGVVRHFGITATGDAVSLREVVESRAFDAIQVPFSLVNPSAGMRMSAEFHESNYGEIARHAARLGMGVFAIRVLAGGALADKEPSPHTYKTQFFPLDLFERDRARAGMLAERLANAMTVKEAALRFVLGHESITSAIVGFGEPEHVDEAILALQAGPLPDGLAQELLTLISPTFRRSGVE